MATKEIRLVRGDELQVVESESRAVALEFDGWTREVPQKDKPADTPDQPKPTRTR